MCSARGNTRDGGDDSAALTDEQLERVAGGVDIGPVARVGMRVGYVSISPVPPPIPGVRLVSVQPLPSSSPGMGLR